LLKENPCGVVLTFAYALFYSVRKRTEGNASEMLVDERRHRIAEIVLAQGAATVADLSERFGVSQVTIRSDLVSLERQKTVKRNRGGAVAPRVSRFTPAFQERSSVHRDAKRAIAQRAARLVDEDAWVLLDAGSTTLFLAEELAARRLTIASNSVYAINLLVDAEDVSLLVVGGELYRPSLSYVGALAEAFLDHLHFDVLFLGTNGVTAKGLSMNNSAEAGIKRKMIDRAKHTVVLADRSKIGVSSQVIIAPLDRVDTLITNATCENTAVQELVEMSTLEVLSVDA